MTADSSPWHQVAREIVAYADYHDGNTKQALAEYRALSKDPKAPGGVRGRSLAMVTFLTAGGDQNVGKPVYPELPGTLTAVPKPGAPTAPANNTNAAPAANNAAPAANATSPAPNATSPAPAETKSSTPK